MIPQRGWKNSSSNSGNFFPRFIGEDFLDEKIHPDILATFCSSL
jgi:hypothetical protein